MTMRALWVAAVTALTLALCIGYASAGPPNGIETPEGWWFRSLKQPNGASCCAETADGSPDCHRLDDNMVHQVGDHWEFLATEREFGAQIGDNKWHAIPDKVLIRGRKLAELGGNPTGKFVLCAMYGYPHVYGQTELMILCAVPGNGT